MDAATANRIEKFVERGASALFAGAVGYSAYCLLPVWLDNPSLIAVAVGASAVAYLLCFRGLASVATEKPRYQVPIFDVRDLDPQPGEELSKAPAAEGPDMLELDDVLAEIEPGSRVVHLFDPAAMPTAGELKDRIDRHLERESGHSAPPDAAEALHEALAELRRSLR
jgi:hypothetical protein